MCTFDDCLADSQMYENRQDWFDHEMKYHRQTWTCNICLDAAGSQTELDQHWRNLHTEKYSIFHTWLEITPPSSINLSCGICGNTYTEEILKLHIGSHLEEISLFSILHWWEANNGYVTFGESALSTANSGSIRSPESAVDELTEQRLDTKQEGKEEEQTGDYANYVASLMIIPLVLEHIEVAMLALDAYVQRWERNTGKCHQ